MTKILALGMAVLVAGTSVLLAQKKTEPAASDIMTNLERGFAGVQDFTATLSADVDMERVRVPKMKATLYFKRPDKMHVESPGFAMLPREGMVLNPSVLKTRYEASLQGKETIEGKELYKIFLTAREARIRPAKLTIWVDPSNWTLAQMESTPYQGRFLKLIMTYDLHEGSLWLPTTLVASFEGATRDTVQKLDLSMQGVQDPDEQRRPPRSGKISIRYSDYKINTGLSDELFEKKEAAGQRKD